MSIDRIRFVELIGFGKLVYLLDCFLERFGQAIDCIEQGLDIDWLSYFQIFAYSACVHAKAHSKFRPANAMAMP